MPLITLIPTTDDAEQYLKAETNALRKKIKELLTNMLGVPPHDVIVRSVENTVIEGDPDDADVHMRIENNPNGKFEMLSNLVRDSLVNLWKDHFRESETFIEGSWDRYPTLEIWKQFTPGSWGLSLALEGDLLTDSVDHLSLLSKKKLQNFYNAVFEEIPDRDHLSTTEFQELASWDGSTPESLERKTAIRHILECSDCQAESIRRGILRPEDFTDK